MEKEDVSVRSELVRIRNCLASLQAGLTSACTALDQLEGIIAQEVGTESNTPGTDSITNAFVCDAPHFPSSPMIPVVDAGNKRPRERSATGRTTNTRQSPSKRSRTTPSHQQCASMTTFEYAACGLMTLPQEILLLIIGYLEVKSLCALSLVSKYMRNHADTIPWKSIFSNYFGLPSVLTGKEHYLKRGPDFWKDHVVWARRVSNSWDKGGTQHTLTGHSKGIRHIQFLDNRLITSDEGVLKEWDLHSLQLVDTFPQIDNKCIAFQFSKERLVVSNMDAVRIYGKHYKELLYSISDIFSHVTSIKFNSERLVTGSWNGTVVMWNIENGEKLLTMSGHNNPVYCMDMYNNVVATGSSDKWIKIWDLTNGSCIITLKGHYKTVERLQMIQNYIVSASRDTSIRLWDLRVSNCMRLLEGHSGCVTSVQFDATKIVSSSLDKSIKVWDLISGRWRYNLLGHGGGVTSMQFEDSTIVTGGEDMKVKIWRFIV